VTLWGGRFSEGPDEALWNLTVSHADRRLLAVDVQGSIAHVAGLVKAGLLTGEEGTTLTGGLTEIAGEAAAGSFSWHASDEDVHTAVERRLGEIVGPVAGKLHTGRSRNDQVALDIRLYLKQAADERINGILGLIAALEDQASGHEDTSVPSYTHLQQAQPISLATHLRAHVAALSRDVERFRDALKRLDVSPLGAGAGGGSRLPLDPAYTAEVLGFSTYFRNTIDAVSARDQATEYLYVATQTFVDLSRLAEDLVLWATTEFGWATFDDAHTTGSSALPQKKNPDIVELTRGKAATATGDLTGLLALQKGLPQSYNRDLQQDKENLFRVDDDLGRALSALTGMIRGADLHPPEPSSWTRALDLAEALVERGLPFREAHEVVGRLVSRLLSEGRELGDVTAEELLSEHSLFTEADALRP
jgi:argininosuccinate lyase